MSTFDISPSDDASLSPSERVEEWKTDHEPLTDRQAIAYWMASTLTREGELFHHDVVDHIHKEQGLSTDLVGTTGSGGASIDDKITDLFHEPFHTPSPTWIRAREYGQARWVLSG